MTPHIHLVVPGDKHTTLQFAVEHWIHSAQTAIEEHGAFYVALSGGSTPKAIYEALSKRTDLDWSKVYLFWSDERSVPPTDPESNYHMAMEAGLKTLPILHIFRMDPGAPPENYEITIRRMLGNHPFDLIMLGMGPDGHTASLFPDTEALKEEKKWVVKNHVPQKHTDRITMTFPCLNRAKQTVFYVIGPDKKEKLTEILSGTTHYPASLVGTPTHPALWIADKEAAPS
ncbi:MAG: 6-phosphogluconolactonase [Simkaniaceae bacterium]|nr:6-phosphogluconolactonase [Simkaniaceae bacterium]